jgi:hypothetical protein
MDRCGAVTSGLSITLSCVHTWNEGEDLRVTDRSTGPSRLKKLLERARENSREKTGRTDSSNELLVVIASNSKRTFNLLQ